MAAGEVPNTHLETNLSSLANALTLGGIVPHANLTGELATLATALMAGGKVPHANLTGELVTLANALKAGGVIPHTKQWSYELKSRTTAPIVLAAGGTWILGHNYPSVAVNDRILVYGYGEATNAGGGGDWCWIGSRQVGGTANVVFYYNHNESVNSVHGIANGESVHIAHSAVIYVTNAGSLDLSLRGASRGGGCTVPTGDGQFHTILLLAP